MTLGEPAGAVRVHGIPRSTCTMRVLAALAEKDVDFELVPVNLMAGEQKQPKFKALQPFGMIPVFQNDAVTLFESRAIVRYVADKYADKGSNLYGKTLEERALVEQWLEAESQNYTPAIHPIFYQLLINPMRGTPTDHSAVEASMPKLESVLDIYNRHLSTQPYLAGDSFTLADLTHMPHAHYLINLTQKGDVFSSREHVKAWWDRVSSRPAWKKVVSLSSPGA